MSQELFNTSAPRGVKPGSSGFCVVAITAGMPGLLEERLTLLSGYRWIVPPGEPGSERNPVAYAHWRLPVGGRTYSVLSRVCDAGFDYSRRSNRFAHHLVIESAEQSPAGPAWVMLQLGVMQDRFEGEPRILTKGREVPRGDNAPRICSAWRALTSDAGWGGVLAEAFLRNADRPAYVIFEPGMALLPLVNESLALLPPQRRWDVTFSTYFTDLPVGLNCAWRFCAVGTKAATDARRLAGPQPIIDLTRPPGAPPPSRFVDAARSGVLVQKESPDLPAAFESTPFERADEDGPLTSASPAPGTATLAALTDARLRGGIAATGCSVGHPPSYVNAEGPASQREALEAPVRAAPHLGFWLLSILWPMIVIGAAGWYVTYERSRDLAPYEKLQLLYRQRSEEHDRDTQQISGLTREVSSLKERQAELVATTRPATQPATQEATRQAPATAPTANASPATQPATPNASAILTAATQVSGAPVAHAAPQTRPDTLPAIASSDSSIFD